MTYREFRADYYRYTASAHISWIKVLSNHALMYLLGLRLPALKWLRHHYSVKYGINLGNGSGIGEGLYLGHAYGINVNPNAKLGKNCSLHKGCTIGQENRGSRAGAPTLGDCVWVGINACIVGNIQIGSDVLIAPNSYVNCDVPDHSIVIGNPAKIIPSANATVAYITNIIEDNSI